MTQQTLLIKNFNHKTEEKATPVGSTALIFMFLLNKENIKNQVRLLPVSFKQTLFISYHMMISISMNQITQCFAT